MLRLLYRNMAFDRSRTLLGVLAVAVAILLVVVLEGFKVGLWQQIRAYREHWPVPLVAVASGAPSVTRSALSASVQAQIAAAPGVQRVHPLVSVPAIFVRDDQKTPIYIVGYGQAGGPWQIKEGRVPAAGGDLVMDFALAKKYRLGVGDRAAVLGRDFQIVGISSGTTSLLGSYVFVGLEDARSLLSVAAMSQDSNSSGTSTQLLVETAPGAHPSVVRSAIMAATPGVEVMTPADLAAKDVALIKELMGSVMGLLVDVSYVVGVLVIGLTLYASVMERTREYGIMKALGARNARLYQFVLGQAAVFTVAGFVIGVAASLGVAALLARLLPQYSVVAWDGQVLLRAGVAGLLMASVASLLPIRQMAGVDAALVFRQ